MGHKFNPAKSQVATFGGWRPAVSSIKIYDKPIEWAVSVKYLGCTFRCRTREVDASIFVGKFCGSFTSITCVLGTKRDEMTAVHLVKSYCLPLLPYSCEIWSVRSDDARSLNVAWNNAFRKVFKCLLERKC